MAHAHETLLWASSDKGARHTFNYDLINSLDPTSQISSVWHIPSVPIREKSTKGPFAFSNDLVERG